jgi:hypothetical protein
MKKESNLVKNSDFLHDVHTRSFINSIGFIIVFVSFVEKYSKWFEIC